MSRAPRRSVVTGSSLRPLVSVIDGKYSSVERKISKTFSVQWKLDSSNRLNKTQEVNYFIESLRYVNGWRFLSSGNDVDHLGDGRLDGHRMQTRQTLPADHTCPGNDKYHSNYFIWNAFIHSEWTTVAAERADVVRGLPGGLDRAARRQRIEIRMRHISRQGFVDQQRRGLLQQDHVIWWPRLVRPVIEQRISFQL